MKNIKPNIMVEKSLNNLHDEWQDSFSCYDDTQDLVCLNSKELTLISDDSKLKPEKHECIPDSNNLQRKEKLDKVVIPLSCDISKFNWLEDTQTFINLVNTKPLPTNHEDSRINTSANVPVVNTRSIVLTDSIVSTPEKYCVRNEQIQNIHNKTITNDKIKSYLDKHLGSEPQFRTGCKPNASEFSQYIDSTQFLAELDVAILNEKSLPFTQLIQKSECDSTTNLQSRERTSKNDFQHEIKNNENHDTSSEILKNPDYRKEIDRIFQEVETTICEFGLGQDKLDLSNSLREMEQNFKDNNIAQMFTDTFTTQCYLGNIGAHENSTKINAILNITDGQTDESIEDIIKKTLLKNATKQVETNILMNKTLNDSQSEFKILGHFFALPNKVKELMKLYKGIDMLYGKCYS